MSPRLVLLLVAVLVLDGLAGVAVGWRLSGHGRPGGGESSGVSPIDLGSPDRATLRALAVERLLDRRARALTDHDRDAYLTTVDPARPRLRRREGRLFDRLRDLPVQAWALEVDGEVRPAPGRGPTPAGTAGLSTWVADVSVRHRLRGFDTGWASRHVSLSLTRRGTRWYVSGERALPQAAANGVHTAVVDRSTTPAKDLWQLGPTRVVRAERSLVVGAWSRPSLTRVARGVDAQISSVSGIWGEGWPRRVVVLVPATVRDMATLLGADPAGLRQIAAVTTGETDPTSGGSVSRIVINPGAFRELAPVGREIVLAHEVTHVAARRVTTERVPTWLAEGVADYVAYQDRGLPASAVAEELFTDVRAGRVPTRLPSSTDFRGTAPGLAQTYEMAWLACVFVADRYGEQTLLDLYEASGRSGLSAALRGTVGLSESAFTTKWRAYLVRRAG